MPIPAASKIGPFLFSGGVAGLGADDVIGQTKRMFENVASIVAAAGGTPDDIAKVTVYVRDRSYRDAINEEWVRMFPDPKSRPARHTIVHDLPGEMLVQLEFVAVLGS